MNQLLTHLRHDIINRRALSFIQSPSPGEVVLLTCCMIRPIKGVSVMNSPVRLAGDDKLSSRIIDEIATFKNGVFLTNECLMVNKGWKWRDSN